MAMHTVYLHCIMKDASKLAGVMLCVICCALCFLTACRTAAGRCDSLAQPLEKDFILFESPSAEEKAEAMALLHDF